MRADVLAKPGSPNPSLALQLNRTEHRNRVLTLIRNGASAEQVSELLATGDPPLEVTEQQVKNFVKRYLNRIHTEDALTIEELRALENERLDRLWSQLAAAARLADGTPNLKVIDRMTRLSERRSKMNGFEAAQRHEHVVYDGLAALGLDPDLVERGRQAWIDSTGADPGAEIIDGTAEEMHDGAEQAQAVQGGAEEGRARGRALVEEPGRRARAQDDEGQEPPQDDGGGEAWERQELPGLEGQAG